MGRLLFSTTGGIGSADLIRGAVFLSVALVLIKASARVSLELFAVAMLLGFATWWCWFALFAKRYRAAGRPVGMAALPLIALILPVSALETLVHGLVAPEASEALRMTSLAYVEEYGFVDASQRLRETGLQEALMREAAVPVALMRGVYALGVAWLFDRTIRR